MSAVSPDAIVDEALEALRAPEAGGLEHLDALPTPLYATDADGRITWFNAACVEFAGRTPEVGVDVWCVTWKLYKDDGEFLPHDQCPMAVAIQEQRAVRGVDAVAERPDGTRVAFRPYPTPMLDEDGNLVGAVNLFVDLTGEQRARIRAQAERCRRFARSISDEPTAAKLFAMAEDYDRQADRLAH